MVMMMIMPLMPILSDSGDDDDDFRIFITITSLKNKVRISFM